MIFIRGKNAGSLLSLTLGKPCFNELIDCILIAVICCLNRCAVPRKVGFKVQDCSGEEG